MIVGAYSYTPLHAQGFELKDPILKDKKTGLEYVLTGSDTPSRQDSRWETFPFRLEFAKGWELYSEVDVKIYDTRKKLVFAIKATQPWLLVRLQPGTYSVYATDKRGVKKTLTAQVPGKYTLRW